MILGVHLTLLIGPTVPVPVPYALAESVSNVTVTHGETGRSAFSVTLQVGRGGVFDIDDYSLMRNPLLEPMNRVIVVAIFNATPRVLSDGFITQRSLQPSEEPGRSTLTLTGEDVSLSLDLVQVKASYPAQDELARATAILARYTAFWGGLPPLIVPTTASDVPSPTEQIPAQVSTDLDYLRLLAARFNYVFHVTPGLAPGQNLAYWGPPLRAGLPQRALSVNMGPFSNVESLSFQHDALAPAAIADVTRDEKRKVLPIIVPMPSAVQPLAARPAAPFRTELSGAALNEHDSPLGESYQRALMRARSRVNRSAENAVTATGQLDALQYGEILEPRKLVDVRGAGATHDGTYYVRSVTHTISRGSYKQSFNLAREGTGALVSAVRV